MMTPQDELTQFIQVRQKREELAKAADSGDPNAVKAFNQFLDSVDPKYFSGATLSPQAKALTAQKDPKSGKTMLLNPETGQYDIEAHGAMSHWETWLQIAAGAAMGGVAATAAMSSAGAPIAGGTSSGAGLTGAGAGATTAAEAAAADAAVPGLASTTIGTGMVGPIAGGTGLGAGATAAGTGAGLGTLGKATSLLGKGGDTLAAIGTGIGDAASAAGNNRMSAGELALRAQQVQNQTAQTNTQGQSAFETELMNRAKEEDSQRSDALKNIYRSSYAHNRTPGPYNEKGLTPYSPEYLRALDDLTTQGSAKLKTAGKYDTNGMPELTPYTPTTDTFDPKAFMDEYGKPSTLEKVGGYVSPVLSTIGKISKFWK